MRKSFIIILTSIAISALYGQNIRSGGKLKPEQAIMDIRHYTVALNVDPEQQSIDGYTEIDLILSESTPYLLFDFWHGLTVSQVWVNGKECAFMHSKDDLLKITNPSPFKAGKIKAKVAYGGKPAVAERPPWTGGFQWSQEQRFFRRPRALAAEKRALPKKVARGV